MILTNYLDAIKTYVEDTSGTVVTQISVDYTDENLQVWATLYDSTTQCDYMVEFEMETNDLTQVNDLDIMNSIVTGLVVDYLESLEVTSTKH